VPTYDRWVAQSQWRYRALDGHSSAVIVIQRVRVRWGAHARGSVQADLRSGLPDAFTLAAFEPANGTTMSTRACISTAAIIGSAAKHPHPVR